MSIVGQGDLGAQHVSDGAADPAPHPTGVAQNPPRVEVPQSELPRHPLFIPRFDDLQTGGAGAATDGVLRVVQDGGLNDGSSRVLALGEDESGGFLVPFQLEGSHPADDNKQAGVERP